MVRRFHRSIYDELDELRASMDYLYQLALEPTDNPLLPPEDPGIVCQYLHNLTAEVTENEDEVTVTADTFPQTGWEKISAALIDEHTLMITCDCEEETPDIARVNTTPEQRSVSLHRVVWLPEPVTGSGARVTMKHGVLDLHLKKLIA